jgi:hypothetical protein
MHSPAQALPGLKAPIVHAGAVTEVRHRGHGGFRFHGGGGFRHRGIHPRGFAFRHGPRFHQFRHFRHGPRIFYGWPYPYDYYPRYSYYYDYDYDPCYWLKVKAVRTGKRYWWRRYEECRGW